MFDQPRQEARDAVAKCRAAGIRVVMISGDHPHTATAIAREIGIAGDDDTAVTGIELDQLSDAVLRQRIDVIAYIENHVPITGEMQHYIFGTISGVITARGQAGAIALLMLIWAAMGFFATLIRTTNQAWGTETANWWRLPFKSLGFLLILVSLVLLGVVLPALAKMAQNWLFPVHDFAAWVYGSGGYFVASLVVFFSLSLFYRLAPSRPTRFAEVWLAALCATALLQVAESLFLIYLKDFATLNAVYGAFGGIMALLLWIYLSGCIFIFGACLCAAQSESRVVLMNAEKMALLKSTD